MVFFQNFFQYLMEKLSQLAHSDGPKAQKQFLLKRSGVTCVEFGFLTFGDH